MILVHNHSITYSFLLKCRLIAFSPALLASMAFVTSYLYTFGCESIQFQTNNNDNDNNSNNLVSDLHFGPFRQQETRYVPVNLPSGGNNDNNQYMVPQKSCVEWMSTNDDEVDNDRDAMLKLVRAFGILAPLFGGLLAIFLWLRICLAGRFSPRTWRIIAILYLAVIAPLQALTFLLFQSDYACQNNPVVAQIEYDFQRNDLFETETCAWDQGSTANVFAVALWFATAIVLLIIGAPQAYPYDSSSSGPAAAAAAGA